MSMLDLFDLGDLLLSWRFCTGLAVTAGACWLVFRFVPNETLAWAICIPLGIVGFVMSWNWQTAADRRG